MTKWFSVLYFDDADVQAFLDIMICLADPSEKNQAHVTLRGPFPTKSDAANYPALMHGTIVSVLGEGAFFQEHQSTVFLRCDSELIQQNWFKRGLGYQPHITIYDGKDRPFAKKLLSLLKGHRLFFAIRAGEILPTGSVSGQKDMGLLFNVNSAFFRHVVGQDFDLEAIRSFPDWKRLSLIDRVCTQLTGLVRNTNRIPGESLIVAGQRNSRMIA